MSSPPSQHSHRPSPTKEGINSPQIVSKALIKSIGPFLYKNAQGFSCRKDNYRNLRVKLHQISSINLNTSTTKLVSKRFLSRKVLKYTSRIDVESSCKNIPSQLRYSTAHCKHFFLHSNPILSYQSLKHLTKSVKLATPKNLDSLYISTVHSSANAISLKPLYSLISTKRQLKNLKLTVSPQLSSADITALRRIFTGPNHLRNLTLITSNLSPNSLESTSPLGIILADTRKLESFSMRCFVTRNTCEKLILIIEKLSKSAQLQEVSLLLQTADRLPTNFYSSLSEKLSNHLSIDSLSIAIDSHASQQLNSTFFTPLQKLGALQKLGISADRLVIGNSEMQGLFETMGKLTRLKQFRLRSQGRAVNFADEYYSGLHQALRCMTRLEEFVYEVKNLGSEHFPNIFEHLPVYSRLKKLSLNLTISEGDLGNVHYLADFMQRAPNIRELSLKINNGCGDSYAYQVPGEVFQVLGEGLKSIPMLEKLDLSLGGIEDCGLNGILKILEGLSGLKGLRLDGSFTGVTYQAFGNMCQNIRRQKRKLREVEILPRNYKYSNYEVLGKVIREIQTQYI